MASSASGRQDGGANQGPVCQRQLDVAEPNGQGPEPPRLSRHVKWCRWRRCSSMSEQAASPATLVQPLRPRAKTTSEHRAVTAVSVWAHVFKTDHQPPTRNECLSFSRMDPVETKPYKRQARAFTETNSLVNR